MTKIAKIVATVAYVGYAPIAPGTAGSAVAAAIYWVLPEFHRGIRSAAALFLILVGTWASSRAEKIYGRDASRIVIDEFAGFFIAVLLLPKTPIVAILGFFIFRVFDIFKPFPIRLAEKLRGGLGVMADDVLAGIFTNILLRLYLWIAL
ncbi:MAG: phosphatidylglycerophosphatase A [Gemmatimonadota bacterium]|nr:MAG: phosphatidylglycerophosphatase A [Gemmatimonadota bacterium]